MAANEVQSGRRNCATNASVASPNSTAGSKRAYHTKARTGCKTCRIRRIRCDERKPACNKCITTGRTCEGYATSAAVPLPKASWPPAKHPVIHVPLSDLCKDPKEMRSHKYFMEVTAPSVAGALNTELWLYEIPRICRNDDAIWHAVVSMGSAHEAYVSGVAPKPADSVYTLQHFNAAIQRMRSSYATEHWWKALVISTIFTSICCLEGKFQEAGMHFKSGHNLLKEFDNPNNPPQKPGSPDRQSPRPSQIPVSILALRSVLIAFEMRSRKTDGARISELPSLLSDRDNFKLWTTYTAPRYPPTFGSYLTPENLSSAIRTSESLFMGLLFSSLQHAQTVKTLYGAGKIDMLEAAGPRQDALLRSFGELERTLNNFKAELATRNDGNGWRRGETHLRQAFLCLCVMQATNRLVLRHDSDNPDPSRRLEILPSLCEEIIRLSSQVISLEQRHQCIRSGGPIAMPTLTNSIAIVVKSGFGNATRKKAIQLLRRPRLEGVMDSLMVARFSEAILEREQAATKEYNADPTIDRVNIDDFTARGWDGDNPSSKDDIHPLARVLFTAMDFTGGRKAKLELKTWREWLEGTPSQSVWIYW